MVGKTFFKFGNIKRISISVYITIRNVSLSIDNKNSWAEAECS